MASPSVTPASTPERDDQVQTVRAISNPDMLSHIGTFAESHAIA
jgi:hypothetical protein